MSLRQLLSEPTKLADIAQYLEACAPDVRAFEANDLSSREQARLFEMAGDGPPIRVEHFVPASVGACVAVHHPGRNTIPVPRYFQRFEKRFSRSADPAHAGLVGGYNASNAWFIRPGYFVAYETDSQHTPADRRDAWAQRGGVVIDYFRVPEGWRLPASWPPVVPNSVGLQRFVYFRTRDFMRRVSDHVSIGRAAVEDSKGDRVLDFWFTLVRGEPEPAGLLR